MCTRSRFLALLCVATGLARAQLYVITGSPNPKGLTTYASGLLRVEDDGAVRSVAELVPKNAATALITVSYDWRKAFLDSAEDGGELTVIDFDKAAVVKKCKRPNTAGMAGIEHWLTNSPLLGPAYEGASFAMPPNAPVVDGMSLDPTVSCEKSFAAVDPSEIRYAVAHGQAAVANLAPSDSIQVAMRPLPAPGILGAWNGKVVDLDYEIPASLRKGVASFGALIISDSHVAVVGLGRAEDKTRALLFRKSDRTWRILPTPGQNWLLRGFGKFIAMTEIQPRSPQNPRSAGSDEWRKGRTSTGPDLAARFRDYGPGVFPGRLYLYDVDTEKTYQITTNQADSEILLVDSGLVYYRVSDRIYAAPVTDKGIGEPRLVARAEEIRDAHWAFVKH